MIGQMRRVLRYEWDMRKRALKTIYKGLFVICCLRYVWCENVMRCAMRFEYARIMLNRCQA